MTSSDTNSSVEQMGGGSQSADKDIAFLLEAARYFEKRPTNGEDAAHWSNVANAANCRRIAERLASTPIGARHD